MAAYDDPELDEDTLAEVADRRARAHPWEAVARELGWGERALRRAARRCPGFDRAYARAAREVKDEAEAEALAVLRAGMRDADKDRALRGAEAAARHLAADRRDQTRLAVEEVRAGVAHARLAAKRAAGGAEPPPDFAAMTPDQAHAPDAEGRIARRAADDRAVVWLWGGAHRVGGVAPDAATDVPLVLFADDTVRGRGRLFWAARFPLPGDPTADPLSAPPPEPVPDLTADHAAQLHALHDDAPVA